MIVGTGNIAKVLNDRPGAILFASGVSNSRCIDVTQFNREQALLREYFSFDNPECLFYFSSISVNFLHTPYTNHKLHMEHLVKRWCKNWNILRIGNLIGDTNPNTFVNAIKAKQAKGEEVQIYGEYRYMISKETLNLITDNLPLVGQNELTVTSHIKLVKDCL